MAIEFHGSGGGSGGSSSITSLVPGVAATSLGKAEDAAHASGDTGVMALTVRKDTAAATATTDGDYQPLITDANGRLHCIVTAAVTSTQVDDANFATASASISMVGFFAAEGANLDSVNEGDGGAAKMTLDRKQIVTQFAHTNGGWTPYQLVSAATTNATSLKASAGQVGYIFCSNVNAAVRYLKLYNKASAPTVGSDTPVHTLAIPGNTAGAGFALPAGAGIAFATGIAFALTTEATVAGTTAVAISEIVVNIGYL